MENMESVNWDAREGLRTHLTNQLTEFGLEITEDQKLALLDYLIGQRILGVKKFQDLGDFHPSNQEDHKPKRTFLINNLVVYLFEYTRTTRTYDADYQEYLSAEDLYQDEYSYEEYLLDNDLEEGETQQEVYYNVCTNRIGDLFVGNLKRKTQLESELAEIQKVLDAIKPVVDENFIKLAE